MRIVLPGSQFVVNGMKILAQSVLTQVFRFNACRMCFAKRIQDLVLHCVLCGEGFRGDASVLGGLRELGHSGPKVVWGCVPRSMLVVRVELLHNVHAYMHSAVIGLTLQESTPNPPPKHHPAPHLSDVLNGAQKNHDLWGVFCVHIKTLFL